MLKSSSIFRRNGAHLVKKMMFKKNKDYPFSRFECFEHAKTFFYLCKTLSMYILQLIKNIPKTFMTIQTIMLHL
jgi:hypothetical protein